MLDTLKKIKNNPKEYICILSFAETRGKIKDSTLFSPNAIKRNDKILDLDLNLQGNRITTQHTYAVIGIDINNNELILVNPWDTRKRWYVSISDVLKNRILKQLGLK